MTQVAIFKGIQEGLLELEVNHWLKENIDKTIVHISHSIGGNMISVMVVYEK